MAVRGSAESLVDRLQEELRRQPAGSQAPSEHELAARHRVNRLTARAVLNELEARHVVRRRRGHGTYVVRRYDYRISPDTPPSWTAAVRAAGGNPLSETEFVVLDRPPAGVARALELRTREPVVWLRRRRLVDGQLAGVADSWIVPDLAEGIDRRLAGDAPMHPLLNDVYGLDVVRSWLHAELVVPGRDIADRLQLRVPRDVIHLEAQCRSRRYGRPVEVTHSWLRADVFRLVLDLPS